MPDQDVSIIEPAPGGIATLTQLAMATVQRTKTEMFVAMPAEVVTWSPPVAAGEQSKPAMVTARPHFKYARKINQAADLNAGETLDSTSDRSLFAVNKLPDIVNVPVHYPGPAGMQSRGPLVPGETGLIIASDKSIDDWIQTGGPVDPVMHHRHNLTDAIFLPGLRFGQNAQAVSATAWLIGKDDGTAGLSIDQETSNVEVFTAGPTIEIEAATEVKLGAGAVLGVARTTDAAAADATMNAWIIAVQVALSTLAAAAGLLVPPLVVPTPPSDFGLITGGSTKVKAE